MLEKSDGGSGRRGSPFARNTATRARSRLEELTFRTFNVRTAAVNGVNGIGYIDTLLRTCAAKGCDVIEMQETKRDGTFEISASGYRIFLSGDCSGVKGQKGQHGVGLAIKKNIVKMAGEGGITIECISARLLKARISIKSNFVTFVVAYAPTKEAPEGQKAKYMAALNCTVASVPAREYVFVLTDANARTEKRGEGGGETDSKVLGAYGRDKLNENDKLLLDFAEDNKLAFLNTFFCTPKSGVSYTFQSANRSKGQARLDYILTKQADRRLIRCVCVRRPPLEAPESDHKLVYLKVRIPRRSAPNRRKRDSTKETPKLADLRRLMTDPNLRCQVATRKSEKFTRPSFMALSPRFSFTILALRRSSSSCMWGTFSAIPKTWSSSRPSLEISSDVGVDMINRRKLLGESLVPLVVLLRPGY